MSATDGRIKWQLSRLKRQPGEPNIDPIVVGLKIALTWALHPDSGYSSPVSFARFCREQAKRAAKGGKR